MPQISFQYEIPEKMIGTFVVDAFVTESYNFSNSVTDIPVEDGSNIADHIVEDQDVVSVEAFIGNTAFEVVQNDGNLISNLEAPDKMSRIQQAYLELKKLTKSKQLFDIVLGLDTFTDMAITSFSIAREASTGANLPFSMEFKKVKVIKSADRPGNSGGSRDQTAPTSNLGTSGSQKPSDSITNREMQRQERSTGSNAQADSRKNKGASYTR